MNNFNYYMPTRLIFGKNSLSELHKQNLPGKNALLVISNGKSVRENKTLEKTCEELKKAHVSYVLFDKVEANPLKNTIMKGAECAQKNGCDFVIALGGGSVMDATKAIAFMATNSGDAWDYVLGGTGKGNPMENKPLPIICITTTAGTGSEVDQWGVITNDKTNEKIGFGGQDELFPVISIVDPSLMLTVPTMFTAYQGFDTLFHATECYISKMSNMMSDMYALTAIEMVGKYLSRAVKNGNDFEAREKMAFANSIAGMAMVAGCTTAEHSLEHAMSAYHQNLPHGAGLIMISKAFHEFFIEKGVCDERFINMAKALGITEANKPQDFIKALVNLQKDCLVDKLKMSDYNIDPSEFGKFATNAKYTMGGLFEANPCELNYDDCVTIFKKSYY